MTAVLTAESRANTGPTRDDKISNIIAECRRIGLPILSPDINASDIEFSVEGKNIRFGLSAIKNVGSAAIESILASRTKEEPFTSLYDFLSRVDLSKVNKKTVESLIKAGAMDTYGKRAALLVALPEIVDTLHKKKKDTDKGQSGLFDDMSGEVTPHVPKLPNVPELPSNELLTFEKELLGFYLTAHPLSSYEKQLKLLDAKHIADITDDDVGGKTKIAGIIVDVKKIFTKAGNNEMAFVKIEDLTGTIEAVVFPKIFSQTSSLLVSDTVVELSGKVDEKDEKKTILADSIRKIDFDR
jgi:DNA polymerase-3 subunit alpha